MYLSYNLQQHSIFFRLFQYVVVFNLRMLPDNLRMLPDIVGIGHQLLHRRVAEEGAWVEAPELMLPTTEEPDERARV